MNAATTTSSLRHPARRAALVLACAALMTLAACDDSTEAPAPAPGGTGGGEVSRTEVRPEERTTPRTSERPTSARPTTSLPYYPPSNCPSGLVC